MRVDAVEFVPSGTRLGPNAFHPGPQLSAASPAFVPGSYQAPWGPAAEASYVSADHFAETISYVDEESFLTPQLLDEPQASVPSTLGSPKSSGEDGVADADPWPSNHSQVSNSSTGLSDSVPRPCAGTLTVEGRRLQWHLEENGLGQGEAFPRGRGVDSPKFSVAGVTLRLVFFPAGTSLTDGDGQCAVAVVSEEKAKLKFELFLNGRRSGMKVMLGQSFSCDFRSSGGADPRSCVALEVHGNLSYAGFY
mmetsp:Transcript_16740/g.19930  ORF Transcript_16740/g.19930 Transcript_16740/m.19930 type:complete len:250 (-) Transcript_16740:18-767(-)